MIYQYKNSNLLSHVGETQVCNKLLLEEFAVFKEVANSSPVDLISLHYTMLHKPIMKRIQIKTTMVKDGLIVVRLRKCGHGSNYKYTKDNVDIIAVYEIEEQKICWIKLKTCREKFTLLCGRK